MPRSPDDGPASFARGLVWASQITSLGLELALPILVGYLLDQRWNTKPWLFLTGALLGISVFTLNVVRLSQNLGKKDKD